MSGGYGADYSGGIDPSYEVERNPDRAQAWDYIDINGEDERKVCLEGAFYEGGFKDGKYLVPFPIEEYYNERRTISIYTNNQGSIVESMVEPVYAKEANRTVTNSKGVKIDYAPWNKIEMDATAGGISLHEFMRSVMTVCRACSNAYIIVDNFTKDEQPDLMQDAIKERKVPYLYMRFPTDVEEYIKDKFGNLISITFEEAPEIDENGDEMQVYRKWDTMRSVMMKKSKDQKTLVEIPGTENVHGLGVLPVVHVKDANPMKSCKLHAKPRLYGIMRLNHGIYNFESELRWMFRKTFFQFLAVQEANGGDTGLGNGFKLSVPLEANHMPTWIAPDAASYEAAMKELDRLGTNLYRLAQQNGVVGVRQAASGIALAYDFRAYRSKLKETASIGESAEEKVFNIVLLYMGDQDRGYQYNPGYDQEYMPHDTSEAIAVDEFLLEQPNLPEIFEKKILLDWFHRKHPDADEEDEIEFVKQLEKKLSEKSMLDDRDAMRNGENDDDDDNDE